MARQQKQTGREEEPQGEPEGEKGNPSKGETTADRCSPPPQQNPETGKEKAKHDEAQSQPDNNNVEESIPKPEPAPAPAAPSDGGTAQAQEANGGEGEGKEGAPSQSIELVKSTRLVGYLTLVLASVINYDAAAKCDEVIPASGAVPATKREKDYAMSVAIISLILSGIATFMHLDQISCFQNAWIALFKPKSNFELALAVFMVIWWSVAAGVQTSVNGVAGDGKGQYSLYFSTWACCVASYWVLERWWVAAGLSSFKSFITSWPYRSPGWLCILFLGFFALTWYLDLWQNYNELDSPSTRKIRLHFESINEIQWQLIVTLIIFTILPALAFVLAEIFRETKPDGSNEEKSQTENTIEGCCLLILVLAWIPAIMWATIPGGAASLVGNAYFSSWLLVIFVSETGVWFVHDLRERIHQSLERKQLEYREKQRQVVENARAIQRANTPQKDGVPRTVNASETEDFGPGDLNELRGELQGLHELDESSSNEDSSQGDYMDALTEM